MKQYGWMLAACSLLTVRTVAYGANAATNEVLKVTLELSDGSRLVGTTTAASVRLVSLVGTIDLPLNKIRTVQFGQDRETAVVVFENGDRLTGVLDLRTLAVQALFGKVEVPLAQCRRIAVWVGRGNEGLVLHYTFDDDTEKVQDRSGLGHDGYWVGAPVYDAGVKGKAARFRSRETYREIMRYYVDGKLEKETRIAASPTPVWDGPDTKLVIGNMSRLPFINWSDMYFNGLVDEVRIYKKALSADDIKTLYDSMK